MQHGLTQWQTLLSDKPLPMLHRTKNDVQALIDQTQLSITQYVAPIVYDAGFSAQLFRFVNTQRVNSGKNPLTTLGNVLSHLGQSAFQRFLNKAPLLESLNLPEKNVQGYMRVMGQACHAALQAAQWAQQRNVVQTEETQLAALLQNITELSLWCYGGDAMPKIEALCYVNKQGYEAAAKTVLGCGMRELGAKLATQWNMPEMASDGLITRQDNFTLATGVSLAAELARIVALNWYGKDATQIIQRIAKHKGKAEAEIERALHLNTVNVNDVLLNKGFAAPAKQLFLLADDNYNYPQFAFEKEAETKAPEKEAVKSTAMRKAIVEKIRVNKLAEENKLTEKGVINAPRVKIKEPALQSEKIENNSPEVKPDETKAATKKVSISKELAAAIKAFQLMVAQAKPAHDLIEQAVKTCLLCGVQRAVFVVKLPKKELLVPRFSAQSSEDIGIKNLKIPINNPHVFSLLMEKNRNLFLNKTNFSKYWNSIPDPVKLSIGVKSFFAVSIFVNNHAVGLMYADKIKGELTQTEFSQFQGICRLLSKGIAQSAHNKKIIE